jgi:DNA modification methylase
VTPWLDDGDARLYHGDCLDVLRELPDRSVQMCATSPPFYGLRDYGHDGQIGLEDTPELWVGRLVAVFREVRRVLRDDGTLWVEIGDSYSSGGNGPGASGAKQGTNVGSLLPAKRAPEGYKQKDLVGQPWMLAFALRADGWYLRSEIIWSRPNPMPESVTDRPTKAHSTVFLLSKQPRYFFDQDAIRTPYQYDGRKVLEISGTSEAGHANYANREGKSRWPGIGKAQAQARKEATDGGHDESEPMEITHGGANARSVWTIPTEPTPFAHFATWPQKLVARMILAGTSERGCCPECGAPWVRDVERTPMEVVASPKRKAWQGSGDDFARTQIGGTVKKHPTALTLGWSPSCDHPHQPIPCTVLDPFAGSGTTMLVARNHGRHSIGIELNEDYLRLAADRLSQLSLLTGDAA